MRLTLPYLVFFRLLVPLQTGDARAFLRVCALVVRGIGGAFPCFVGFHATLGSLFLLFLKQRRWRILYSDISVR